jgi:SAM-dependent methyltransferase
MPNVERTAEAFTLRARTLLSSTLVPLGGHDVLNIGSSFGWFEREATRTSAKSVVGIDIPEDNLQVARRLSPRARFVSASVLDLPFANETFDVVCMFEVLEHLPVGTELKALQELHRVLRPNGTLALSTPHRSWFATWSDPAFYLIGHRHYRIADVQSFFDASGFESPRVVLRGGTFDQLDLLLYYFWRHIVRREQHPFRRIRLRAEREWDAGNGRNTIVVTATRGD